MVAVPIARPAGKFQAVVPVPTATVRRPLVALVAFVRGIACLDHAAVRGGSAWRLVGVLAKLWINAVNAGGDQPLAGGEGHAPEVLAPDAPVFVIGAGATALTVRLRVPRRPP